MNVNPALLILLVNFIAICSVEFISRDATAQQSGLVSEILIDRWDRNRENRNFEFHSPAKKDNPYSGVANLAYTVNRIHHYKYNRAHEVAKKLVLTHPKLLDAWYSKCWLDIRAGEIDAGLISLKSYRDQLDLAKALPKDERAIHLRRIARLVGFVDGAANAKANPETLQQTLDRLMKDLNDADRQVFDDQYHEMIDKFTDLVDQTRNESQNAVAMAVNRQKQELAALNQESQQLAQRETILVGNAEQVRVNAQQQLSDLGRQVQPLDTSAAQLDSRIIRQQSDLGLLYTDLAITRDRAYYERDPYWRHYYAQLAADISFSINRKNVQLSQLQAEFDAIIIELDALRRQMAQVESMADRQLGQINVELTSVNRQQRRNNVRTDRASKPPKPRTSIVTSLENRTGFIGTYDPFPDEAIRQALLQDFD